MKLTVTTVFAAVIATVFFVSACDFISSTHSRTTANSVPIAPRSAITLPPAHGSAASTPHATTGLSAMPPTSPNTHTSVDAGTHPTRSILHGFLGENDDATLARLCTAPIERIERNRGGVTLSFRVWFADSHRGLFKPQQQSEIANYRAELAAYRLSRLMNLDRVPPACGRRLSRELLQRAADRSGDAEFSRRTLTELLGHEEISGAMIHWVPGRLEPVAHADTYPTLLDTSHPLSADEAPLAADLSTLILFDYLIDNVDRWSGGNILRPSTTPSPGAPLGPVLFMDNGASFSALHDGLGARPNEQALRLRAVRRFSPRFVRRLRDLTEDSLREAMATDPLGPILSDAQRRAVLTRRDRIIAHVDGISPDSGGFDFP